ncbi:MAG: Rrf2 family transcriptional regulator [Armatimonadetes bacterium]|nr:Rrf2 family transcriptional regulator [Armatimonadota bacterium]
MLKLPAGVEYSLLAMLHLTLRYPGGELVKAADIAAEQDVPLSFLERLLAQLRAAGLLESTRGPGGGHRLSRPPDSITAGEVLTAIVGPGGGGARLRFLWEQCERALEDVLNVSLAELATQWSHHTTDVADYQI